VRRLIIAFDSTDKQGGFIGAMYAGGNNVAVELVREGLASVHSFSAEGLPFGRELAAAEEEAKNAKKNVSLSVGIESWIQLWADYTGEEVEVKADDSAALAPEYLDVYVSSVKEDDPFGFSVQILKSDSMSVYFLPAAKAHN
jgi:staphylococcal nuclease domain-containing protein 1